MRIIKRFFRNISIFVLAGLFSLAVIFVIKNPNLLQASVLNAGEISLIQKNKRDIAYKQSEGLIDIFFSPSVKKMPVTIVLAHKETIYLDGSTFSGQCSFNLIDINQETSTISIDCPDFNSDQSILIIPFIGSDQDILLEEGYYFDNDIKKNFSIGNLSLFTEHSN